MKNSIKIDAINNKVTLNNYIYTKPHHISYDRKSYDEIEMVGNSVATSDIKMDH